MKLFKVGAGPVFNPLTRSMSKGTPTFKKARPLLKRHARFLKGTPTFWIDVVISVLWRTHYMNHDDFFSIRCFICVPFLELCRNSKMNETAWIFVSCENIMTKNYSKFQKLLNKISSDILHLKMLQKPSFWKVNSNQRNILGPQKFQCSC